MFCTKCGHENADNAKFCTSCGHTLPTKNISINIDKKEIANKAVALISTREYLWIVPLLVIIAAFLVKNQAGTEFFTYSEIQTKIFKEIPNSKLGLFSSIYGIFLFFYIGAYILYYVLGKLFSQKKYMFDILSIATAMFAVACSHFLINKLLGMTEIAARLSDERFTFAFFKILYFSLFIIIGLSIYNIFKEFKTFNK